MLIAICEINWLKNFREPGKFFEICEQIKWILQRWLISSRHQDFHFVSWRFVPETDGWRIFVLINLPPAEREQFFPGLSLISSELSIFSFSFATARWKSTWTSATFSCFVRNLRSKYFWLIMPQKLMSFPVRVVIKIKKLPRETDYTDIRQSLIFSFSSALLYTPRNPMISQVENSLENSRTRSSWLRFLLNFSPPSPFVMKGRKNGWDGNAHWWGRRKKADTSDEKRKATGKTQLSRVRKWKIVCVWNIFHYAREEVSHVVVVVIVECLRWI